jgi:hypothetical protein
MAHRGEYQRKTVVITCTVCGEVKEIRKWRYDQGQRICSKACKDEGQKK